VLGRWACAPWIFYHTKINQSGHEKRGAEGAYHMYLLSAGEGGMIINLSGYQRGVSVPTRQRRAPDYGRYEV